MHICDSGLGQPRHETAFNFIQNLTDADMQACLNFAQRWFGVLVASRYEAFVKREINIRKRDAIGRFCELPASGMSFLGRKKARFAQLAKHAAHHHRVGSRMFSDV